MPAFALARSGDGGDGVSGDDGHGGSDDASDGDSAAMS